VDPALPGGGQGQKIGPHGLLAGKHEAHEGPFRRGPGGLLQGLGAFQKAELVEEAAKLKPLQKGPKPLPVGLPPFGEVHLQGQVGAHLGQVPGELQIVHVGQDLLPDGGPQPVQVLEEPFQAPPLLQKLPRRLLPDALDPGKVVGLVPGQGPVVGPLVGPQAVLFPEPGRGDEVPLGVEDVDAVGKELVKVSVGGEDTDLVALLFRLLGQAGQDVVRLVARDLEALQTQEVHQLLDEGELPGKVLRRGGPARLVPLVGLVAEGGGLGVKDHDHRVPVLLEGLEEALGEAVDRLHRLPPAGGEALQGVEGAVGQVVAVHQEDPALGLKEGQHPLHVTVPPPAPG